MTNSEKQWEAVARVARLRGKFYANFVIRHPDVKLILIHDSCLFESMKDYQLFTDELEQFLRERRQHESHK